MKANSLISKATWTLVDNRAMARNMGMLTQQGTRRWKRKTKASLNSDRRKKAANVAIDIDGHLVSGNLKEARCCLKNWYTAAMDKPPKPCHASMEKQTVEREELYWKVSPPGDPILINVKPFGLDDSIPEDVVIRVVVEDLKNVRAGGSSGV